jgi:hypothetical protein
MCYELEIHKKQFRRRCSTVSIRLPEPDLSYSYCLCTFNTTLAPLSDFSEALYQRCLTMYLYGFPHRQAIVEICQVPSKSSQVSLSSLLHIFLALWLNISMSNRRLSPGARALPLIHHHHDTGSILRQLHSLFFPTFSPPSHPRATPIRCCASIGSRPHWPH